MLDTVWKWAFTNPVARPRETTDDELLGRVEDALVRRESMSRWSLAEVAESAGVAPATLVKRFGSRRGLLTALSRRWIAALPSTPPEGAAPRVELGRWVAETFAPAGSRKAAVVGLQLLLEDLGDGELTDLLRKGWNRQIEYLALLLHAADLPRLGDARRAATILFDSLNGARLRAAAGDPDSTPADTLQRLLEAWT